MKVFVSYTIRDGLVDKQILMSIEEMIKPFSLVYIDLLHNYSKFPQFNVIKQLLSCSHIILLISPKVYKSPWVRFELIMARIFKKKIIKINIDEAFDQSKYNVLYEKAVN